MTAEFRFIFPERHLHFDADERVDWELLLLSSDAWRFLDETLAGLRIPHDATYASKLLLVYFGVRIQGASAASAMLVGQRLGREAIIISRCQYDYFLKMLYYDTYHKKADEIVELVDAEAFEYDFRKKAGLDLSHWSSKRIAELEKLAKKAKEPNFTDDIKKGLKSDLDFTKAAADGNPFAKWFFANIDSTFANQWKYGSSIVHASPLDLSKVFRKTKADELLINVDSRMKAPNKTIADISQRCFSAMALLRWRFGLSFSPEHIEWATRLNTVMERHLDEPTDVYSMHD